MSFSTPDLSDENPEARALSPILKNLGGKKVFWGKIETLQCPDDNSFVKELFNSEGEGKVLVVDAKGISSVALLGATIAYILFNGYTVSTLAGGSFSQTAFAFAVTGEVVEQGLTLALFVGFIGGVFPAWNAARRDITEALRSI